MIVQFWADCIRFFSRLSHFCISKKVQFCHIWRSSVINQPVVQSTPLLVSFLTDYPSFSTNHQPRFWLKCVFSLAKRLNRPVQSSQFSSELVIDGTKQQRIRHTRPNRSDAEMGHEHRVPLQSETTATEKQTESLQIDRYHGGFINVELYWMCF